MHEKVIYHKSEVLRQRSSVLNTLGLGEGPVRNFRRLKPVRANDGKGRSGGLEPTNQTTRKYDNEKRYFRHVLPHRMAEGGISPSLWSEGADGTIYAEENVLSKIQDIAISDGYRPVE